MKTQEVIHLSSYQAEMDRRLEEAIASVVMYQEFGFATVASHSKPGTIHIVDMNENYYGQHCDCKGNHEYGRDCLHLLAVDRYGDTLRPDFYTMNHIERPAIKRAA